jgi:hypothetical protein
MDRRAGTWLGLIVVYVVVLWLTSMAGPYWALWLWSVPAFPLFLASGWRHARQLPLAIFVSIVWAIVALGIPLASRRLDAGGGRLPFVESLEVPLALATISWPAVVTWLAYRLRRRLTA